MPRTGPSSPVRVGAALAAAAFALLAAAPAGARNPQVPAACVNLAHQLVHYDTMRARAAKAGNAMWVRRLDLQIDRVEDQLAARCPKVAASVRNDQQLAEFLKLAARGALTFFTLGAY